MNKCRAVVDALGAGLARTRHAIEPFISVQVKTVLFFGGIDEGIRRICAALKFYYDHLYTTIDINSLYKRVQQITASYLWAR